MPPTQIIRTLNIPSDEEKDALAASATPSAANPFATMADISSIDDMPDVDVPAPTVGHVLKWNGAAWVSAVFDASFAFALASFTDNQSATQLIGVGQWMAIGGVSFTVSYTNGPPVSASIALTSTGSVVWLAPLNLTAPFADAASVESTAYPGRDQSITFTITAAKGVESATSTATVTFRNNIKYGTSLLTSGWDINALSGSYLSNTPTGVSFPITAGAGDYLLFAFPATYVSIHSLGFVFNAVTCPFQAVTTISVTNNAGYTENYKVYRSTLAALGSSVLVASTSSSLINHIKWGVSSQASGYTSASVGTLSFSAASNTKGRTLSLTAGAGEYLMYALPARLGTVAFSVGGFSGGFLPPETVSVTNVNGYVEDYYVYRSDNHSLGATSIGVI